MTIVIDFHHSGYRTFKVYYAQFVQIYWGREFSHLVSYTRFIELLPRLVIPLAGLTAYCHQPKKPALVLDQMALSLA